MFMFWNVYFFQLDAFLYFKDNIYSKKLPEFLETLLWTLLYMQLIKAAWKWKPTEMDCFYKYP